ncbi:MAG: hypothetical protein UEM90_03400, partial [Bifidobacterium pseudocatenulatum]|nr:hypothetical protein [Bifidobacterium pseudocatenulatum]
SRCECVVHCRIDPDRWTMLSIPDGHGAPLIALESETAEEARLNTRKNIENGVNAIKGAGE